MSDTIFFRRKHQLWLRIAFTSFATTDLQIKNRLYEFSVIEFRHLKWIAETLVESNIPYDYERDKELCIESETLFELLTLLIKEMEEMQSLYDDSPLSQRLLHDERYMIQTLKETLACASLDEKLTAFNRSRQWGEASLSSEQLDALTLFLFEESYKEYELIMVYFYSQMRASTPLQYGSFQDLIDESHLHLRSFGEMMAKMGILSLPRMLHPRTYKITDMEKFLRDGITEEENAKEECRRLSGLITDEKLSTFFEFINFQESYHIEIMKKLLKEIHG
ncbi:MAG: iron-binding protein [Campylobacterales bacterium]|nr:iron-binding protein [Campylobacterales bacterium]